MHRVRYSQKENSVTPLSSDEECDIHIYPDKFTQHLEKKHWLGSPRESADSTSCHMQQVDDEISVITQVFHVSMEEEKYLIEFGEGRQAKFSLDFMERTGASLKLTFVKDQGLYMTVSGNPETVKNAQKRIFSWSQEHVLSTVVISKEQHCSATGKTRHKVQDLEQKAVANTDRLCLHDQSHWIRNAGTNKVMEKSPHQGLFTSADQDKYVLERFDLRKSSHTLASGPYGKSLDNTVEELEAHTHAPSPSARGTGIIFNQRKPQVDQAEPYVEEIFENTKKQTTTNSMDTKLPHHFTIGPEDNSMQEILESSDSLSDSSTHSGDPESLGEAFTEASWEAKGYIVSTIWAPSWLHRFIISKKGQNIAMITQKVPRVHIEFTGQDKITLRGPTEDVNYAQEQIELIVKDLLRRIEYAEMNIDCKFHKYLIGKNGDVINRIKEKNKVSVLILPEESKNLIRIEGETLGVQQAKRELLELAANMENDYRKDLIIEQRFHRTIIGQKGERIHDIRKKFPEVMINFPDPAQKSDTVQIRGPKQELEKCTEYLENVIRDIVSNSYSITLPIFKKFHKSIVGKGGENIKKICAESHTKINVPSASSNSENIIITGKPENCEVARNWILSIQKDIANISEVEVSIPSDLHKSLIDTEECLISSIMKECGKINILFPRKVSGLQKVIIRGPAESVEKAKQTLLKLAEERSTEAYSVVFQVKPQCHQFLMTKAGGNFLKVCSEMGVHIIFPTFEDKDQEPLTLTGKEEAVKHAQKELEALIKDLDNLVEDTVLIKPKYHHHFLTRRGQVLQEVTEEFGGVIIRFSCSGKQSNKVTIKGAKPCVLAAKKHIQEIIGDLHAEVTTECLIPQKFHHFLVGTMCSQVRKIARDYNVQIKFPDRERPDPNVYAAVEENRNSLEGRGSPEPTSVYPRRCDTILISGRKEKCDAATIALKSLIPVTAELHVPFDLHRYIVGQKGSGIHKIIDEFEVSIQVSEPGMESDIIFIKGPATNVERAKERLQERVKALQAEIEDRELRNFKLMFTVDPKYHSKIIGRKGLVVAKICLEHDVTIHFPSKESDEVQDQVIITGYKNNTLAARDTIMKLMQKIANTVTKQIQIHHQVHGHIIGFHGRNIHKIMNRFQVEISFPPKGISNKNITVTGYPDKVKKAIDHLFNLEKYYLSIVTKYEPHQKHNAFRVPSKSFAIKDVPCAKKSIRTPPDVNNGDFPKRKY